MLLLGWRRQRLRWRRQRSTWVYFLVLFHFSTFTTTELEHSNLLCTQCFIKGMYGPHQPSKDSTGKPSHGQRKKKAGVEWLGWGIGNGERAEGCRSWRRLEAYSWVSSSVFKSLLLMAKDPAVSIGWRCTLLDCSRQPERGEEGRRILWKGMAGQTFRARSHYCANAKVSVSKPKKASAVGALSLLVC